MNAERKDSQNNDTEIKNYRYVSVNQLCDVIEDFVNKNIDLIFNHSYYLLQFNNNRVYDDKFDKNKFNIKPTLISIAKDAQLKENDINKLFKCKKLYLKIPKKSKTHFIHKYFNDKSYIVIIKEASKFTIDGKELKYHQIFNLKDEEEDNFRNKQIQEDIDLRLESFYDSFSKNYILLTKLLFYYFWTLFFVVDRLRSLDDS